MSAEDFEPLKRLQDARKELRRRHAQPCPVCRNHLPKAQPKMLLPGESCGNNGHTYRDPRPRVPRDEWLRILAEFGLTEK